MTTYTYNVETMPIAVVVAPGEKISLSTILKDEFGAAAAHITSLSLAYFGKAALADYDPHLRYWTSKVGVPDSKNDDDVMTQWWKDDEVIGATPLNESSTDYYPEVIPTGANVVAVTKATMSEYSLVGGTDIAPFAFITIPAAYNSEGVATVYDQYSIVVEKPGIFSGPSDPGKPTPDDIIAAAEAYAAAYPGVPNDNDCHFIAQNVAAAAGAGLDDPTESGDPDDNISQGFWRVVYRGSDGDPVQDWSTLVEPGDIVRMGWDGEGLHTTTVVAKAATPNANGTYTLTVYDNDDVVNGVFTIGIHPDTLTDDGLTYDTDTVASETTIYRLDTDDLYLITGANTSEALYGNIYDDKMVGGAGDDFFYSGSGAVNEIVGGSGVNTFVATQLNTAEVSITPNVGGGYLLSAPGVDDTLSGITFVDLDDATVLISDDTLTETWTSGARTVTVFDITGHIFTTKVISYNDDGQIVSKLYEGVTGEGNLSSFEYVYAGGALVGTDDVYTGIKGATYAAEELDYNGAGQLSRAAFSDVSGKPYSSYEYDYVGGVFAGSDFTYTSVPAGATYSSYEVDYNWANAYVGEKFFFTDVTGQDYAGEEVDFDASNQLSRVLLTGVTGQAYYQLEEDYSAGAYEGYKAYYLISGQSYTSEEVDVSASGQIEKVIYSGMTSTPYSSVEEDFSGGAVSTLIYGYTNVTGETYYAYDVNDNSGGGAQQETFDLDAGGHNLAALTSGQTLTSLGLDKMTGDGATTFVLDAIYGADTILNFNSSDTISLPSSEFADFSAVTSAAVQSGANVVITASDGDTLTLKDLTAAELAGMSANFTFHS